MWDLADRDMDGKLTQAEFAIAIYLVERIHDGHPLPAALPPGPFPPTYLQHVAPPPLLPPSLPQSPVSLLPPPARSAGARVALDFFAAGAPPPCVPSSPKLWQAAHHTSPSPHHPPAAATLSTSSFDPMAFDTRYPPGPN